MLSIATLIVFLALVTSAHSEPLVSLYRYWNGVIGDSFYTSTYVGRSYGDWILDRTECKLAHVDEVTGPNTVDLYQYWNDILADHLYTTEGVLPEDQQDWVQEVIVGKCFSSQDAHDGLIPLYRYWKEDASMNYYNHFYTTDATEIGVTEVGQVGLHDFISEGITCYVFPRDTELAACESRGLSLKRSHMCQCSISVCDGAYCNSIHEVGTILQEDPTHYCPDGTTCCCSCPNCIPFLPPPVPL
eukprot:90980_1